MKKILFLSILFSLNSWGNSGVDILLKNNNSKDIQPIVKERKQIVLDDAFKINLYGSWKAARIYDEKFNNWVELIFDNKLKDALKSSYHLQINKQNEELIRFSRLYLLWKLKLSQSFFNEWIDLSVNHGYLNSPFSVSMDQILGQNIGNWFVKNAILISKSQRDDLKRLEASDSIFNIAAQAYFNLRKGEESLKWIGKLPKKSYLRVRLANSVIIHYAKKNELAKAAKVLKEIYEPALQKENNKEKLADYYLTLGRLLYQAQAYDAAKFYYELIPDESKKYLSAQSEKLWITMRKGDISQIKGDTKTLEMSLFEDQFNPEVYLVSSMANLKTCQFKAVEKNFNDFIRVNKAFSAQITKNLNSSTPRLITKDDFYVNQLTKGINKVQTEQKRIVKYYDQEVLKVKGQELNELMAQNKTIRKTEIKRKWKNRKKLLEKSIRKMRFVKVEFLSTMRRLKNQMAKIKTQDKIQLRSSGLDKSNRIQFPYDGIVFADELFHYQSELQNLCLRGRK